jgi:hypothetical protein
LPGHSAFETRKRTKRKKERLQPDGHMKTFTVSSDCGTQATLAAMSEREAAITFLQQEQSVRSGKISVRENSGSVFSQPVEFLTENLIRLLPPKDTEKGQCSVCGKGIASGSRFIMVVYPPPGLVTFKNIQDVWEDRDAMSKRVESESRPVCERCMMSKLPRWIKNAGNAGLLIATNQIARRATPGELCPQCLRPAEKLIWGVLNDNNKLYDWFWWCTDCKAKWWYSPEKLPDQRPHSVF